MSTTTTSATRSKKVKALLAGGLVLGVGAAVTLASWTDQAYVDATFGTSNFNIQVNTEGGEVWAESETAEDASQLAFSVDFAGALQPGDTVYAPLSLRTDEDSVGGTVTLEGASLAVGDDEVGEQQLFDALTYTVADLGDGVTCDADGLAGGEALLATSSGLSTGSADGAIKLGAAAASSVDLCFALTLPEDADSPELQGLSTTALWHFDAKSADNASAA